MNEGDDGSFSLSLTGTVEIYGQTFKVRLSGVSHTNEDGTSRQDLLARSRPGEPLELRREPNNPHDSWAIAVHRTAGGKLGYVPAGDRRLAEHIDRGGEVSARIAHIDGGPSFFDRLFRRRGKSYGCVIEIVKGDFDWKRVTPFMNLDRTAAELCQKAKQQEKADPDAALRIYEQACAKIRELDSHGKQAQAWRTTRQPVNRMSLVLERKGDRARALEIINQYLSSSDPVGLTRADKEAISSRRERLTARTAKQYGLPYWPKPRRRT